MKKTGKPKCFPWGTILSFIVTPLGWGPSSGLVLPSPEPQVPIGRQFTEPKTELDSRGTLPTTAGNADKCWIVLGPKGLAGGRHAIPPLPRQARGPHSIQPRARFGAPQIKQRRGGTVRLTLCRITECTQDGQGGFSPQESLGRTERDKRPLLLDPASTQKGDLGRPPQRLTTECTQDGQGGFGPQESLGRTNRSESPQPLGPGPMVECGRARPPVGLATECAQDDQGGFGPQESLGRTKRDMRLQARGLVPAETGGQVGPPLSTTTE